MYKTHNMSYSRTYRSFNTMRQRCTNPKNNNYFRYGGRGISVCDRWRHFEIFLKDMGERPVGTSLDRIDNDKGYTPSNCRWATPKEQHSNRRGNVHHTINGVTKTQVEWLRHFGVKTSTYSMRIYKYNWPVVEALTTPARKRG